MPQKKLLTMQLNLLQKMLHLTLLELLRWLQLALRHLLLFVLLSLLLVEILGMPLMSKSHIQFVTMLVINLTVLVVE
jgi:hypothetical protein